MIKIMTVKLNLKLGFEEVFPLTGDMFANTGFACYAREHRKNEQKIQVACENKSASRYINVLRHITMT